jgi:hypothetical protein
LRAVPLISAASMGKRDSTSGFDQQGVSVSPFGRDTLGPSRAVTVTA